VEERRWASWNTKKREESSSVVLEVTRLAEGRRRRQMGGGPSFTLDGEWSELLPVPPKRETKKKALVLSPERIIIWDFWWTGRRRKKDWGNSRV
jgi:hypothetical protein